MAGVEGKIVFVTGAGSGIGRATSRLFARRGASVVVADLSEDGGHETVTLIENEGGSAFFVKLDVSDEQQWTDAVAQAVEHFGGIDVLVNDAGIYFIRSIADTTLEAFNTLMSINVTGVWLGAKHVVAELRKRGGGSIINLSSIAGLAGSANHSAYGASKGAVRLLTKDLAAEFAPDNIRVNSVHPGYVKTQMADQGAAATGLTLDQLGQQMAPLGRLADVDDVANMIVFLAMDESSYLTGAEFVVDGGTTATA